MKSFWFWRKKDDDESRSDGGGERYGDSLLT